MIDQQEKLAKQGFLDYMDNSNDHYKLSANGSKELLYVFSNYDAKIRKILKDNRKIHKRSQRKIEVSQLIEDLGLIELETDLAEEWTDFFIMRLFREGFFAWWQPKYSDDWLELWYYYSEDDERDFLGERNSKN